MIFMLASLCVGLVCDGWELVFGLAAVVLFGIDGYRSAIEHADLVARIHRV